MSDYTIIVDDKNTGEGSVTNNALYLDVMKRCLTGYSCVESNYAEIRLRNGMTFVQRIVVKAFAKKGYKIYKVRAFNLEAREFGRDWPSFCYSMIGLRRFDNLQYCVETVLKEGVPGDLMETGVWRGGASIFMRAVLKAHNISDRDVYVVDSFEGLPAPTLEADREYDLSRNSYLAVSIEDVQTGFRRFGLLDGQVKFLKGWFKDTLPAANIDRVAVLRLDGDLYESTMDVLNSVYHKVSARGFVIVDDYHALPPCKQAVDDFREREGIRDPIQEIDGVGVYWRKASRAACPAANVHAAAFD